LRVRGAQLCPCVPRRFERFTSPALCCIAEAWFERLRAQGHSCAPAAPASDLQPAFRVRAVCAGFMRFGTPTLSSSGVGFGGCGCGSGVSPLTVFDCISKYLYFC